MKNEEMNEIAENYIKRIENDSKIETVLINELIIKKPYGNIFSILVRNIMKLGMKNML